MFDTQVENIQKKLWNLRNYQAKTIHVDYHQHKMIIGYAHEDQNDDFA